ncbi:MAG: hypothetical protein R3E96_12700 [Planctomycetota bacterium]
MWANLLLSITDPTGKIESVQQCVPAHCRYEPAEILGALHRIIRHPHMPRAVFRVLWNFLLAGRPVGAYVKNMAKSGQARLASPRYADPGWLPRSAWKPTSGRPAIIEPLTNRCWRTRRRGGRIDAQIEASTGVLMEAPDQRPESPATSVSWPIAWWAEVEACPLPRLAPGAARARARSFRSSPSTTSRLPPPPGPRPSPPSAWTSNASLNSADFRCQTHGTGARSVCSAGAGLRIASEIENQANALDSARSDLVPACEAMYRPLRHRSRDAEPRSGRR